MNKFLTSAAIIMLSLTGCEPNNDQKIAVQQEEQLSEANKQIGMPAILNFNERKMLKQIYELRDQTISTHSYIFNQYKGCLVYLGASMGYGVPYATQYSNPQRLTRTTNSVTLPQAEPNGLFSPADAQGTWINLLNPETKKLEVVYVEPQVTVSPFRLTSQECK